MDYLNERGIHSFRMTRCQWHDSSRKSQESTDEFIFWKANQAVPLGSRETVKIKGEHANVDQQLLFQRLLSVRKC